MLRAGAARAPGPGRKPLEARWRACRAAWLATPPPGQARAQPEQALAARVRPPAAPEPRGDSAPALGRAGGRRLALAHAVGGFADPPVEAALAAVDALAAPPAAPSAAAWAPGLCAVSLLPLAALPGLPTVAWGAGGRCALAVCAQLWLHRIGEAWPDLP